MIFKPEATFDVLFIVSRLKAPLNGVTAPEIHLFAYLACILSLYGERPVDDWAYTFAGTASGSPFSPAISDAIETLERSGFIQQSDDVFTLTTLGTNEYELLRTLSQNAWREAYLTGACDSVLALPVGVLRDALSREPALERAAQLERTRQLLEDADLKSLYDQFDVLSEAIGVKITELMVPAVAWLSYLSQVPRQNSQKMSLQGA